MSSVSLFSLGCLVGILFSFIVFIVALICFIKFVLKKRIVPSIISSIFMVVSCVCIYFLWAILVEPVAEGGKPVIYLYGYDEDVSVSVDFSGNGHFTCVYPNYDDGWNVSVQPDSHLIVDNNTYRYLYWEGVLDTKWDFSKGFCVKGSDTAVFLREKLEALGLNDDEINEFIIYWLPRMQDNEYNVIAFQTDRYTQAAKLDVSPAPDNMIRVFMAYYASDSFVDIEEQDIVTPVRFGKTVVEWGGDEVE